MADAKSAVEKRDAMTIQDCAREAKTNGAQLIRYRKDSLKQTGTAEYDCKPMFTGSKRGWIMLDSFTGSAIVAVFDALSSENQAKFHRIPLSRLIPFVWKHVRGAA